MINLFIHTASRYKTMYGGIQNKRTIRIKRKLL
jgi:hypothetical protein